MLCFCITCSKRQRIWLPRLQKWLQWEFWVHRWAAINSRIIIVGCIGCRRVAATCTLICVLSRLWRLSPRDENITDLAIGFSLIYYSYVPRTLHSVTGLCTPVIPGLWPHSTKTMPERLVSGSDDFTLIFWHPTENKRPIKRLTGHQQAVNHLAFSLGRLLRLCVSRPISTTNSVFNSLEPPTTCIITLPLPT